MPRYFFHVEDGQTFTDLEGTELDDLKAARCEAVRFAGALLADQPDAFWNSGAWTMRVTDEVQGRLFTLQFFASDAAS